MRSFRVYKLILGISIFTLLASCKSSSVLSNLPNAEEVLYQKLYASALQFDWFSAKAKVRMESSQINGGGRMNIRMKKDSIIWFNFKKVSIEGARGIISPHQFTIIYRTEKKYERGALNQLFNANSLPISFDEAQSVLAGRIPLPIKSTIRYEKRKQFHWLSGQNQKYTLSYSFDDELNLVEFDMTDDQNRNLHIRVDKLDESLGIFKNRKLTYYDNQIKKGFLEVDLSNIEIDVPKTLPFSIPDHYTQY